MSFLPNLAMGWVFRLLLSSICAAQPLYQQEKHSVVLEDWFLGENHSRHNETLLKEEDFVNFDTINFALGTYSSQKALWRIAMLKTLFSLRDTLFSNTIFSNCNHKVNIILILFQMTYVFKENKMLAKCTQNKPQVSLVFLIFKLYDAYLKCFSLVALLGQRLHSEDTWTLIYTCLLPIISSLEAFSRTLSAPFTETAYPSYCLSLAAGRVCAPDWLLEELCSSEPVLSQGAHVTKARRAIRMLAENLSCSEVPDIQMIPLGASWGPSLLPCGSSQPELQLMPWAEELRCGEREVLPVIWQSESHYSLSL